MPSVLAPDWLGQRVVVRRRSPEPSGPALTDALGDLTGLTESHVTVDTRTGPVTFERRDVVLARLVRPSTAAQLGLEAVAAQGWRAAVTRTTADGWLLRADGGWTGRANSALPLRTARRPLADVLEEVTDWYAGHGLPARIQVPLPAGAALDRALDQLGWSQVEDVAVLTTRLDLLLTRAARRGARPGRTVDADADADPDADPDADADLDVAWTALPDEAWLAAYHYRGGPLPAGAAALLGRHERAAFFRVREPGGPDRPVRAIARAVVDDGWLGLTAVEVAPAVRRRGVATRIVGAAAAWAVALGAQRCYLQVSEDNTAALAFYARLGLHRHHAYRYRVAPQPAPIR